MNCYTYHVLCSPISLSIYYSEIVTSLNREWQQIHKDKKYTSHAKMSRLSNLSNQAKKTNHSFIEKSSLNFEHFYLGRQYVVHGSKLKSNLNNYLIKIRLFQCSFQYAYAII